MHYVPNVHDHLLQEASKKEISCGNLIVYLCNETRKIIIMMIMIVIVIGMMVKIIMMVILKILQAGELFSY